MGALLVGRSSSGINGLVILPGVIDADYEGQIHIIAYTLQPPLTIQKGTRVAQLVVIQRHEATPCSTSLNREGKGFGSTGNHVVSLVQQLHQRPQLAITITYGGQSILLTCMTDTGADVTIFSRKLWPKSWPLHPATEAVQGVAGGQTPLQSVNPVQLKFPEGQVLTLLPYVMPLPTALRGLIGRDVLSQLGATVNIPHFP